MVEGNELDSTYGISDEELTELFKASIKLDKEICEIKGLPIAGYDDENNWKLEFMVMVDKDVYLGK